MQQRKTKPKLPMNITNGPIFAAANGHTCMFYEEGGKKLIRFK